MEAQKVEETAFVLVVVDQNVEMGHVYLFEQNFMIFLVIHKLNRLGLIHIG